MKKLFCLLVLLLFVSCSVVHSEGNIRCYNHHICVGDYYTYNSYKVYIVEITTNLIQIQYANGRVIWVRAIDFENHATVVKSIHKDVHTYKDKKDYDDDKDGTRGMKKHKDNGKHKGQYK